MSACSHGCRYESGLFDSGLRDTNYLEELPVEGKPPVTDLVDLSFKAATLSDDIG